MVMRCCCFSKLHNSWCKLAGISFSPPIKGGIMSASLCDTTTEDDIHINDTLVSQGVAIYVKDTEEEQGKYNSYPPEPTPLGVSSLFSLGLL